MTKSLFTRLLFTVIALFVIYGFLLSLLLKITDFLSLANAIFTFVFAFIIVLVFKYLLTPFAQTLSALDDGIKAFKDNDYSITIHNKNYRETDKLVTIYNQLATTLRNERMDIFQRELLLDTVIQSTPVALVLTRRNNTIVYSNIAAKQLFKQKKPMEGASFVEISKQLSNELHNATINKNNGLVSEFNKNQQTVYNVNCRKFTLNGTEHELYLYKNITHEISQKENDMWKQVIRMISHELNNSLAPITSLTHSAQKIIEQPEHAHMLHDILTTIGNRSEQLHNFISQYAEFARLPSPKLIKVELNSFLEQLQTLTKINCQLHAHSNTAVFDSTQIEQVLINLVKNAKESGSDISEIKLVLEQKSNELTFSVTDRGCGLSESQMQQALLPFFTTKATGTGVGLALCNEIVVNHGGRLRLINRDCGGLYVGFSIPITGDNP